jgi:adenylate kinase
MNLIIFGPQGSGKGTQAKLLVKQYSLFYFESGKFLRNLAKTNEEIKKTLEKGELIPDEEIFRLTTNYLEEKCPERKNILFDGYPRSVKQYELLKQWLEKKGSKIDRAIFLEVSQEESVKRLSARRIDEKTGTIYNMITNPPPDDFDGTLTQRSDDRPEAIKERLALYKKETEPLVGIFSEEGILMRVNGERPIQTIFEDVKKRLDSYLKENNAD